MAFFYRYCGKLGLLLYMVLLWRIFCLCKYGGSWGDVYGLVPLGVGIILCFFLWLLAKCLREKGETEQNQELKKGILRFELLLFAASTVAFCANVIHAAIPYNGALSWKLEEWFTQKEVRLEHDNIFEDGVSGILLDLDRELKLPEELYITERFQVGFNERGKIEEIDTFLYGTDEKGNTRTYLVMYNADMGDTMTVCMDQEANTTYADDMRLEPMLKILQAAGEKGQMKIWCAKHRQKPGHSTLDGAEEYGAERYTEYEILYFGRRSFSTEEGLKYLPGDVDGDGAESGPEGFGQLQGGGEIIGFEVSLHIPEREEVIPVRYIMEPEYIAQEQLNEEQEMEQIEAAIAAEKWIVDQSDGSVYFFLNENVGWRLVVVNAAAGSRYYGLEKTEDGGKHWDRVSGSPFEEAAGASEGLLFLDEKHGFAGLSGASESHSQVYVTKDGGTVFEELRLPMDTVTELPEHAAEYGFSLEDYDYMYLPEEDGDALTILVVTQAGETEGILFRSEDQGETWTYAGRDSGRILQRMKTTINIQ